MRNDPWRARLHPDVTLAMPHGRMSNGYRASPAQGIVEAIRGPLPLLGRDLHVTAAAAPGRRRDGLP